MPRIILSTLTGSMNTGSQTKLRFGGQWGTGYMQEADTVTTDQTQTLTTTETGGTPTTSQKVLN